MPLPANATDPAAHKAAAAVRRAAMQARARRKSATALKAAHLSSSCFGKIGEGHAAGTKKVEAAYRRGALKSKRREQAWELRARSRSATSCGCGPYHDEQKR
jgi:hypothetical protein